MGLVTYPQHKERLLDSQELLTFIIKFNPIIADIASIDDSSIKKESNYSVFCNDIQNYLSGIFKDSKDSDALKKNFDISNIDVLCLMIESFYQDWNKLDFSRCREQIPQIICTIYNLFLSYKIKLGIDEYRRIAGDELLVKMNDKGEKIRLYRNISSTNQKYNVVLNEIDPVI